MFQERPEMPRITAVCIPPGTELVLRDIPPELRSRWKVAEEETVTFTQISDNPYSYRDAVRFRTGLEVLLQNLREGMRCEVASVGDSGRVERDLAIPVL
jgi:hypothetical protein